LESLGHEGPEEGPKSQSNAILDRVRLHPGKKAAREAPSCRNTEDSPPSVTCQLSVVFMSRLQIFVRRVLYSGHMIVGSLKSNDELRQFNLQREGISVLSILNQKDH